ncbi:ABC transporter ATP-binding protein [Romboutsia maritimum]|uniref:Nickel import system ATP-binding protein NikD n=1 Tax=Romboutsia maritimum TaxID=2020948 RepID=A0A371IVX4_9FIRM|nr:ABC transporter ATP-binding protein [Romboutsia maritimum]RDY24618.1 ABC transporter ATP-binding protein [Romboutsia maritimum]
MNKDNLVLDIENLVVDFNVKSDVIRAVDNVNLKVKKGKITVLVGESGSGKSVTATSVMGLLDRNAKIVSGLIKVKGKDVSKMNKKEKKYFRGKDVGMIFQNPMQSLNPLLKVESLVSEAIMAHSNITKKQASEETVALLERVHLSNPREILKKYPFQLSGGMCQRVMIAIAMAMKPSLLIADEPTTALDVTVQVQILNEICNMVKTTNTGVLFITHDLGIVAEIADYVYVMKNGKIVEMGDVYKIFKEPEHEYTKKLLSSII